MWVTAAGVPDSPDVHQIDERRVGFAIGDVSGNGIPAAIFMQGVRDFTQEEDQQDDLTLLVLSSRRAI